MTDFASILNDSVFTFVVGPQKQRFKIHVAAFKRISESLGYLMTNSKMKEAIEMEAELPDCDPETFIQFAKYAYMGICGAADGLGGSLHQATSAQSIIRIEYYKCHICNLRTKFQPSAYPFCGSSCKQLYEISKFGSRPPVNVHCVSDTCSGHWPLDRSERLLCNTHAKDSYVGRFPSFDQRSTAGALQGFAGRTYGSENLSHEVLAQHLDRHSLSKSMPLREPLMQHARLYCFAHQHMVQELQDICLHKLHRNLVLFNVATSNVDEVIELILFAYANTVDEGDILKGTSDRLRGLVMAFVMDRSKKLMKHQGFRVMLGAGGPHTADFFALNFGSLDV